MEKDKVQQLKDYLAKNQTVSLAFLYGSTAKGRQTDESDVDLAVYLQDTTQENRIWQEVSKIVGQEVDLVVLNNAPATLTANVFKTGLPLAIKNRVLYWNLYLDKTLEAEDFADFVQSYWQIYQRSRSLIPEDRTRFLERLEFLTSEMVELEKFRAITQKQYQENKPTRRELERWTENIINALIDCAKIILASRKKAMPKTYEEALRELALMAGLDEGQALRLSSLARLRNILAHEYLDILYDRIKIFLDELPKLYEQIAEFLKKFS